MVIKGLDIYVNLDVPDPAALLPRPTGVGKEAEAGTVSQPGRRHPPRRTPKTRSRPLSGSVGRDGGTMAQAQQSYLRTNLT